MPLNSPTYQEVVDRNRASVSAELPELDPTIFGSFVRAFTDSQAGRAFDIVVLINQLQKQLNPLTADDEFLEVWASYEGLTRNVSTVSSGEITVTGTLAAPINIGTSYSSDPGNLYDTKGSVAISAQSISISTLTRAGFTATATATNHRLATGISVVISGAVETEYNGTYEVTVISADEFEYTITGTPTTPATGTVIAAFNGAFVEVESQATQDTANGIDVNLGSGAKLNLTTPISGVDTTGYVQFGEVGGGTDTESNASLLNRTLQSRSNPVANFNPAAITKEALKVAGVTRVLVKRITPYVGAVTVLFVRDDDPNIIPSASEVQDVEDVLLVTLPAQSEETDLFVKAPTPVSTDYSFTSIVPSTGTMQTAINNSIDAFYRDEVTFEDDITEDQYRAAIIDTIDLETGDKLSSFTLSTPAGNIAVGTDRIGVKGTVTF